MQRQTLMRLLRVTCHFEVYFSARETRPDAPNGLDEEAVCAELGPVAMLPNPSAETACTEFLVVPCSTHQVSSTILPPPYGHPTPCVASTKPHRPNSSQNRHPVAGGNQERKGTA